MPDPVPLPAPLPDLLPDRRLDLAARAAWLYHAKNQRQDEVARALNLSRQTVQRLIALAASEHLIRFQLVHPLAACVELAGRLAERFRLDYAEVVPSTGRAPDDTASVAAAAAFHLEAVFESADPVIVGIGGQRVLREAGLRICAMQRPMHRLVSLMGTLTRQGRAGHYDVVMGMAERIGAQCFPLPAPVVTDTADERRVLQAQTAFRACLALVEQADLLMMGIGFIGPEAPLHRDGFITTAELDDAIAAGAIGELLGNCFDASGAIVAAPHHDRLTSFSLPRPARRRTVVVQRGPERVPALHAALSRRLANGLITDERTARELLDR